MSEKRETWASRVGFIAATIGMAIGTGNIWRFPRVAANNGGGPFIIAWTVALFVWAIPLHMGEMTMGRKTGLGTIGAFRDFMGKKYAWMGTWIAMVCLLLMSYYSVVMGWCLKYFTLAATGTFKAGLTTEQTEAIWSNFTASGGEVAIFHFICMAIAGYIIYRGVQNGIEKFSKVMIPVLFLLLAVAMVRAVTLPGAYKGLEYLFNPKFEMLKNPKIWLEAFTQVAWSTGAGWGFIITLSTYTKKKEDVPGNCFTMGISDNVGALLAGMVVLPAIFALSPSMEYTTQALTSGNTGLTFIYLAQLFGSMPGGYIIGTLFFFSMAVAALTSLIPMIEVVVRNIMDTGVPRHKATIIVSIIGFVFGLPSALNVNFLDNQDWVWGVGLLVSGLFVSFALMKYGVEQARQNVINTPWADFKIGKWWNICIYAFPAIFAALFGWWMWQGIVGYPDNWMSPFETFNAGTIIVQFGLLILFGILTNNYFCRKIGKGRDITQLDEDEDEAVVVKNTGAAKEAK
ncbi:sodium-dependent transporter [Lutispora saccharofermentans]|uniref:Sodium-dependent transporter n=1 Tax=Lutispora saccharofermentans TaxID=3024236 RepID=A0ABT1NET3_9FIRM|nr:sodium-dependent transporter [Lutispora saccharofermentans]MCQ1529129.1 sodium-dependent transporter [Lutispora saccharofermentans]